MTLRLAISAVVLAVVAPVAAQQAAPTPQLTKPQRELLKAIVTAVGQAADQPDSTDVAWPMHVMRASDGSHYVAFSATPGDPLPTGPMMLYVRLATAPPSSAQLVSERSTVEEWLTGKRADPIQRARTGIVPGEMPAFGAGAIAVRGSTPSTGSTDLSLMSMERERARQAKEDAEKERKRQLEGQDRAGVRDVLPFEDFEVAMPRAPGARGIERALTAGPGDYLLYIGWADPAQKAPARVHVIKRALHLPPASTTQLMLSSVVVADSVGLRQQPYSPEEQRQHPYTLGATEIIPAADSTFTRDERIAVAFQIINAKASETGKPSITVNFRVARMVGDREQLVASLNPQRYDEASMPADFDLRLGHPIFAAVSAPLASLARGDYRLKTLVSDLNAGTSTTADTPFRVIGTPLSLLAEAPPVAKPFDQKEVLDPSLLEAVVTGLRPSSPSPALARALDLAQRAQFVELMREEPVPEADQAVRIALTAMALYAVGDASSSGVQSQRALQLGAPAGPVQLFLGAARATQNRDADAIAAWLSAIDGGFSATRLRPFLLGAYLRRGEPAKAAALVTEEANSEGTTRVDLAAVRIASAREADAIPLLRVHLADHPGDGRAEWLLLHALFATVVKAPSINGAPNREAFTAAAQAYVSKGGEHAALVTEWLKVIS